MPYLTASAWLGNLIPPLPTVTGSSTVLTVDEVASIVARTSAEIDSAAANAGYVVPISSTATTAWATLEETCGYGAGWKVLRAFFPNTGGPGGNIDLASEYRDAYRMALAAIRDGTQPLIGASTDASETVRLMPRSYSTSNQTATAGVMPTIDVDKVY